MSNAYRRPAAILVATALTFLATTALTAHEDAPEAIDIGTRLQLFLDEHLIETTVDVERQLHQPDSAGTAIAFNQPWEGNLSNMVSVIKDGDTYRMYYRGGMSTEHLVRERIRPDETIHDSHPWLIAYAESSDGIHWEKPSLGIHEFNGSTNNNIILMGSGDQSAHPHAASDAFAKSKAGLNFSAFLDENPDAAPDARFKAVAGRPLMAYQSADGIHWEKMQNAPIVTDGTFDSQNVAFWDHHREQYVLFYRDFRNGIRSIKMSTSKDFLNWEKGQWLDFGDAPVEHLYTNAIHAYPGAPHLFIGFPKRFQPFRTKVDDAFNNGVSDGLLMSSRDGLHWERFEEAFIRPGMDDRNWIPRGNRVMSGIYPLSNDTYSIYVLRHNYYPSIHLERMEIRKDGFVSLSADMEGGVVTTRPVIIDPDNTWNLEDEEEIQLGFFLNYSTSAAGSIKVEFLDVNGNPLPGFSLDDSPLLFGDSVNEELVWERPGTRTDTNYLHQIAGNPVRIRFHLKDADLYSFQFSVKNHSTHKK